MHNVELSGRTLYKDGKWNTLCLPFDLTLSGSVLDGGDVTAKVLDSSGTSLDSEGLLTLSFTDAPLNDSCRHSVHHQVESGRAFAECDVQ